jgi:hypothetical protein
MKHENKSNFLPKGIEFKLKVDEIFFQKHLHSIQIPHIQLFISNENLLNDCYKNKLRKSKNTNDLNIYYSNFKKEKNEKDTLLVEKKIIDDYF